MKYRSRMDIISNILHASMSGATKTRLMYDAYLSYYQLREYLVLMQEMGLLIYNGSSGIYRLSEKGMNFLNTYEEIEELFGVRRSSGRDNAVRQGLERSIPDFQ